MADKVVHYLHESFVDLETQEPSCVLIRFFKTYPYQALDENLRQFASQKLGTGQLIEPDMPCLTLLASVGKNSAWDSREKFVDFQTLPLSSKFFVGQFPMMARLFQQFGLDIDMLAAPTPDLLIDLEQKGFNIFHVPNAIGSKYIPAQKEFVIPWRVRSALGFGGMLPSGDIFTVIMFSKVPIPAKTAEMFKPLALCVKMAILPHLGESVMTG